MTNPTIEGIRAHGAAGSGRTAVLWRETGYTYAELERLISARASALRAGGVLPSTVVAVEGVRGLDTVVDIAALWTIGVTVLVFPAGSEEPLVQGMVVRSQAAAILHPGGQRPKLFQSTHAQQPDLEGVMLILPTSGSTGEPKLVPLAEDAVGSFCAWAEQTFCLSSRRTLCFAPLNFDLSLFELWAVLANGGSVELVSDADAQDPAALRSLLRHSGVDLIQGVPFVFKSLTTPVAEGPLRLSGVRDVITTGSSLGMETRLLMSDVFPQARFHNMYGSTETNNSFMASFDTEVFLGWGELPIGSPLPGVQLAVRESSGVILDGPGSGELMVRTPFMMTRYVGLAASGEKENVPALFSTGDVVHRDPDGIYHLEARSSRIVKIRGNRVSLDQVEASINSNDAVDESVVIALDDDPSPRIVALVRIRGGINLSPLALRVHCSQLLPPYALPSRFQMVDLPFPRTSTDKVDRKLIRLTYLEGTINA